MEITIPPEEIIKLIKNDLKEDFCNVKFKDWKNGLEPDGILFEYDLK